MTGEHKYPPRFYYTSYALGSSAILWCIKDSIVSVLQALKIKNFAVFVGSHTFWIYLWHIPVVDYMINRCDAFTRFLTTYIMAIFLAYLQSIIVEKYCRNLRNDKLSKKIKMIFVG